MACSSPIRIRNVSSIPALCEAPKPNVAAVLRISVACVARRGEMRWVTGPTQSDPRAIPWYTNMPRQPTSVPLSSKVFSMCSSAAGTAPPSKLMMMERPRGTMNMYLRWRLRLRVAALMPSPALTVTATCSTAAASAISRDRSRPGAPQVETEGPVLRRPTSTQQQVQWGAPL